MALRHVKKSWFSMIELLIVMSIIVLLAGIVMTGTVFARRNARNKRIISQLGMIRLALTEYHAEYNFYPVQPVSGPLKRSTIESLLTPNGKPYLDMNEEAFNESAANTNMTDAYGNPFYYQSPGTMNKKTFDLWSMGPDGKHGLGGSSPADAQTASDNSDDVNTWLRR